MYCIYNSSIKHHYSVLKVNNIKAHYILITQRHLNKINSVSMCKNLTNLNCLINLSDKYLKCLNIHNKSIKQIYKENMLLIQTTYTT